MGILERTGVLDRYKVSPTQGTSGLLTGQPALSPFAQQAARNIGGALGMDMRTQQEKITQGMAEIAPDDPQRMAKMYGLMIEHGKPEQKIAALGQDARVSTESTEPTKSTAIP